PPRSTLFPYTTLFRSHLDEGAIWVRGTLAPSTGFSTGVAVMHRARLLLSQYPEAKQVMSQVGRPDDGTDASGFYNTEFFVDTAGDRKSTRLNSSHLGI